MTRHYHLAAWLLREARYKLTKWRRGIYTYQPTPAATRRLRDIVRDTFKP